MSKFSIKGFMISGKLSSPELAPMVLGLISGLFIFYSLYFLEAYGIKKGVSYSGHSLLFRSISFGVLTFLHLTTFETFLKPKWAAGQVKYVVGWYLGLAILGSQFVFILFNFFWNWQEWNLEAYLLIIKEFPLMMLVPFSFYLTYKKVIISKNPKVSYLLLQSKNGKNKLKIKLENFLYARSSENYVSISYTVNDQVKEHLIRKPLKILEKELKMYPEIQKPHRSYLINITNIQSVKQVKDKVFLGVMKESIPVSKKYHNLFLN